MSATYGSTSGFSKTTSKTFERAQALDNLGANIANVLKFARTETTTETVTTVFGAPEIGALDVLDATIVHSVDETVIDPSASSTVPPAARSYNPRAEATATVLGTFTGATFELDGITFTTDSHELSETAGDFNKTSIRGTSFGAAGSLTVGSIVAGGTVRTEKRFSKTDFVRTTSTAVAFASS